VHPRDPEEREWAAFDAALRKIERPGPNPSLRDRLLKDEGGRRKDEEAESASSFILPPFPKGLRDSLGASFRTVLVVDDEPNIRRLIEHHLTREGYGVLQAADGPEALAKVREERPDLIILDVIMPGPDGFRVLEALKGDPRTAEIPVIMLTALGGDDSIRRGWQTGNDCYLSKPFNPEELLQVVRRIADVLDTPDNPPPLRRWLK
jgi:two-component system, OmpR family, alkaline phosphatase synthesis response regulator PhoP